MHNRTIWCASGAGLLALSLFAAYAATQGETFKPSMWSGLKYRMIGPYRGGRVTTVTGVPSQPYTFYMGSTGGGVWKTTDAGHTWVNISRRLLPRGLHGRGRGVAVEPRRRLRRHRLFEDPQQRVHRPRHLQIHRCRQDLDVPRAARRRPDRHHPRASRRTRISCTWRRIGNPFVANKERGVYRSTDGGKTWKKVLFVSDTAGAADLELQPGQPERAVRLHVARPAQALDHHQRRAGGRHLQEHRRRRHLDEARRRPAE